MKTLVVGGTGTVGTHVVNGLLARQADVFVLTRDADKAKRLPGGARAVIGDLLDLGTVRTAFEGMDAVFMLNAMSPTEAQEGMLGVNGARLAGVKRFVYMSVQDADQAAYLPHFGAKVAVEAAVQTSGLPFTILRPNNFFQNDGMVKDALLQYGVYPFPIGGQGISRVDTRDIAEAALAALTADGHAGKTYNIVGPEAFTGATTAAAWSRALGRPIAYAGDDLDAWEQQALQFMPDWMVFDVKLMFAHFQKQGLAAAPKDIERLTAVLGHPPRKFEDWARETAKAWQA